MVVRKYGKDINMRFLKRDLKKIKEMIENCSKFSQENLIQFNKEQNYECRICHNKELLVFQNIRGYVYAQCANCESIVLLNIPDTRKLYDKEGTKASTIYLDEDAFQRRVETIAFPKIEFVVETMNLNGGGGYGVILVAVLASCC